jgi:hypothetical protein
MYHLRSSGGKKTREGATSGVGRLERMKLGNGIVRYKKTEKTNQQPLDDFFF